ncbi:hypothetical protein [Streptomyces sp. NPDC056192]|uniref:hypothetical protein n=1 Tax=Streptomyces sp. NPDC056192 TaxID=3345743 RepID=UPI0035DE3170
MPQFAIPDDVPSGPLREYLMWLRQLHEAAGEPSSRELADELRGCAHTTVARLFKAYPKNTRLAWRLIRHLAENPVRPLSRTEAEWDAFYDEAERLLARAREPGQPEPHGRPSAPVPPASTSPAQEPYGPQVHLIHANGPNGDNRPRSKSHPSVRKLRRLAEVLGGSINKGTYGETLLRIHPFEDVAAELEAGDLLPAYARTVLAVYEGFHRLTVTPEGISFGTADASGGIEYTLFSDLSKLLPRCERAIVLLSGDVRVDADEYAPHPNLLVQGMGPTLIAEVSSPDEVGYVVNRLAKSLSEIASEAESELLLSDLMKVMDQMPDVRRCFTLSALRSPKPRQR